MKTTQEVFMIQQTRMLLSFVSVSVSFRRPSGSLLWITCKCSGEWPDSSFRNYSERKKSKGQPIIPISREIIQRHLLLEVGNGESIFRRESCCRQIDICWTCTVVSWLRPRSWSDHDYKGRDGGLWSGGLRILESRSHFPGVCLCEAIQRFCSSCPSLVILRGLERHLRQRLALLRHHVAGGR